jgi:hypothetical protein
MLAAAEVRRGAVAVEARAGRLTQRSGLPSRQRGSGGVTHPTRGMLSARTRSKPRAASQPKRVPPPPRTRPGATSPRLGMPKGSRRACSWRWKRCGRDLRVSVGHSAKPVPWTVRRYGRRPNRADAPPPTPRGAAGARCLCRSFCTTVQR